VADEDVTDRSKYFLDAPHRVVPLAAVLAIGGASPARELGFVRRRDQALAQDQSADHPDREGAAAEAETEEEVLVIDAIIATGEFIDVDDVALQPKAEGAAENGPWLERRRTDAVVIECDLVAAGQIERLEGPPHIGAPHFGGRIAGAI